MCRTLMGLPPQTVTPVTAVPYEPRCPSHPDSGAPGRLSAAPGIMPTMTAEAGTRPLSGKVALVAGATRGAGRAIAVERARAGALVYATGRSSRVGGPSE